MAKESKEKGLDFFYYNKDEKKTPGKQKKKTKKNYNKSNKNNNTSGLSDNEIIIGVNTKPVEKNIRNKSNNKKTNNKKNNSNKKKNTSKKLDKSKATRNNKKKDKNKNKIIIVLVIIGAGIAYLITSPIFNISKVEVLGNKKITSDTYISLSGIAIGNNIYDLSKKKISQNLKQDPYVDTVKVKRKLPNTIEITVTERNANYMLKILNSYAYIDNQGYILEINEEPINVPVITGFSTETEVIFPGNRLNSDDLSRLDMVLKIMDTISISGITETVNEINISDKNNYTLIFSEEGKIVYLGDCSNLTDRINIYLKAILQKEKGKSGEIFINGDLNQDKVFFREKV